MEWVKYILEHTETAFCQTESELKCLESGNGPPVPLQNREEIREKYSKWIRQKHFTLSVTTLPKGLHGKILRSEVDGDYVRSVSITSLLLFKLSLSCLIIMERSERAV